MAKNININPNQQVIVICQMPANWQFLPQISGSKHPASAEGQHRAAPHPQNNVFVASAHVFWSMDFHGSIVKNLNSWEKKWRSETLFRSVQYLVLVGF